ncbi:MAG: hypothetical protein MUF64_13440 [Polyangiaceae bacterium]|jgi:hypothetical protein|nr:hypothetical protein [Polyangiaceae bacterium]
MRLPTSLRALVLAAVTLAAPLLQGCPSNVCLLTVNGRCEVSTCGHGQVFNDRRNTCVCAAGRIPVGSGCLTQFEAKQYCGKGSFWGAKGCEPIRCREGDILEQETEMCVPKSTIDKQAGVGPGQTLACAQGTVLVINQGQGSCVPVEQSCTRDEFFDPTTRACAKLPTCPTGFEFDPVARQCIQVAQQPGKGDDRSTVQIQPWAQATYGVHNGQGSQGLCGPLARKPLAFGVLPGGSVRLVISLNLGFPGGVTDGATVQTQGLVEASGQPVSAKGAQEIQGTAEGLLSGLRAQQAHANPTQGHQLTVKCLIVNAAPPQTIPSTGGA